MEPLTGSLGGELATSRSAVLQDIASSESTDRRHRLFTGLFSFGLGFAVAALCTIPGAGAPLTPILLVCSRGAIALLCCAGIAAPSLSTALVPVIQVLVIFASSAIFSGFGHVVAANTMAKATIWLSVLVYIMRLPLRLVRLALAGAVCLLVASVALGATAAEEVALDGVAFGVLILLFHQSASAEHRDRVQKLQERYQLRKAALLSEQLLRTILPDDIARQLLRSVPPERLTRHYENTSIAFINLEGDFYRRIVSGLDDPASIIAPLDAIWSLFDDVLEMRPYR